MPVSVEDGKTIVEGKEASTIHNKGAFGKFNDNRLYLTAIEAFYLINQKRLEVPHEDSISFLEKMNDEILFQKYLVYRDVRQRGFIVEDSEDGMLYVYERGTGPHTSQSSWSVECVSEKDFIDFVYLYNSINCKKGKKTLIAVSDEEGDITYYEVRRPEISGKIRFASENKKDFSLSGLLQGGSIIIDKTVQSETLHSHEFFGKSVDDYLVISLIEGYYLMTHGILKLKSSIAAIDENLLRDIIYKKDSMAHKKMGLYFYLKNRGLIPKTGFKFGTMFRAYTDTPEKTHADFLVHPFEDGYEWFNMSRAIRLSHGVRKKLVYIDVEKGHIIQFRRVKL